MTNRHRCLCEIAEANSIGETLTSGQCFLSNLALEWGKPRIPRPPSQATAPSKHPNHKIITAVRITMQCKPVSMQTSFNAQSLIISFAGAICSHTSLLPLTDWPSFACKNSIIRGGSFSISLSCAWPSFPDSLSQPQLQKTAHRQR